MSAHQHSPGTWLQGVCQVVCMTMDSADRRGLSRDLGGEGGIRSAVSLSGENPDSDTARSSPCVGRATVAAREAHRPPPEPSAGRKLRVRSLHPGRSSGIVPLPVPPLSAAGGRPRPGPERALNSAVETGRASRSDCPTGNHAARRRRGRYGTPRRGQSVPRPACRRRYADAP